MSKDWRNLQVSSRLLVIQDIISTTTTTASDAKLANDAHLLEREFKNSRDVKRLDTPPSYQRTACNSGHHLHHHLHHCIWCQVSQRCKISWEIFQKFWEMSKDWRNLQVSSRLLVFQDIISTTTTTTTTNTTTTTTTTASDAKLANDAWFPERYFRNFERCRKTGETSKLAADCL